MIEVTPARAKRSTLFQTVSTLPQVVSTRMQPRSRSRAKSSCGTPKAGMMTTSSGADLGEVVGDAPRRRQEPDPHLLRERRLTPGLWMISPISQIVRSGKRSRAS